MLTNVIAIIAILVTVSGVAWYKTLKEVQKEVAESPQSSAYFWGAPIPADTTTGKDTMLDQATTSLRMELNKLYISEQQPGGIITAAVVSLESPGFISVREDIKGKPGKIIGLSRLLQAGETGNVEIALGRNILEGEVFWGTLYVDDGDKKFNALKDKQAKDSEGNFLIVNFKIVREKQIGETSSEENSPVVPSL